MKISAIICAAGKGERAGFGINKLLAPLYGVPALWLTLEKFASAKLMPQNEKQKEVVGGDIFDEVIVTSSREDFKEISAMCAKFGFKTILGGKTRTESVYSALKACSGDIVLIHDGARPYVTAKTINGCIDCVKRHRSAICATPSTDTIAAVNGDCIGDIPERNTIFTLQTPQGFYLEEILSAYEKAIKSGMPFTDDSSVYLKYVGKPHIFIGDEGNKKLTYGGDFINRLPFAMTGERIGFGVDVHSFGADGNYITLCGVKIPSDSALIAHSDGDVAVHALMDALLSSVGLKDIGHYFPDTDPKYRNIDSTILLKKVVGLLEESGYRPNNVSLSVQAQRPKLAPYIGEMKGALKGILGLDESAVAIAAGTSEKLGYVGRGAGICVYCAVSVEKLR